MNNLFSSLNKTALQIAKAILLIIVMLAGIMGAVYLGFWYGFNECFNQPSCSPVAQGALFLFPLIFIIGVTTALVYFKGRKSTSSYPEKVAQGAQAAEVLEHITTAEQHEQTILNLIAQYEELTLQQLQLKTTIDKEELLLTLRKLLQDNLVSQRITDNQPVYSLKR